jgi:hypothetical protein
MKKNYKLSILRRIARYGHPFIKGVEKRKIDKYAQLGEKNSPVFIVGAPRTGSTILYQLLTHYLDLLYINNFAGLFYRDLFFGIWLSRKFLRDRPHNCFDSFQGDTYRCGLKGPAECGDFWYRWLPRDRHYIGKDEVEEEKREEIGKTLFAVINRRDKPFLIKNLNAGQRMGLFSQITPDARFIFIRRNPLYAAQSIWLSKKKIGLAPHQWWSIMPKNYDELVKLPAHRQIVRQIFFLEKQILDDRRYFPAENFIAVEYEELCRHPLETVETLQRFIGPGVKAKEGAEIPDLDFSETQKINEKDFLLLEKEVNRLDWENYRL